MLFFNIISIAASVNPFSFQAVKEILYWSDNLTDENNISKAKIFVKCFETFIQNEENNKYKRYDECKRNGNYDFKNVAKNKYTECIRLLKQRFVFEEVGANECLSHKNFEDRFIEFLKLGSHIDHFVVDHMFFGILDEILKSMEYEDKK
ncbi:hypothetical protein H311_00815 [Anncaliia algerae PRA109]|nr:hypothetical protein H311_00815 [Anncaliia algerae PRA109]